MRRTLAVLFVMLAASSGADDYLKFERASVPSTGGTISAALGAELAPALTVTPQ